MLSISPVFMVTIVQLVCKILPNLKTLAQPLNRYLLQIYFIISRKQKLLQSNTQKINEGSQKLIICPLLNLSRLTQKTESTDGINLLRITFMQTFKHMFSMCVLLILRLNCSLIEEMGQTNQQKSTEINCRAQVKNGILI